MKLSPHPAGPAFRLSDSAHHRLNMYALAASAAGVGALALAPSAEARIIYTKAHTLIPYGDTYHLDLNHEGKTDFTLQNNTSSNDGESWYQRLTVSGNGQANELVASGRFAAALRAGSRIGAHDAFENDGVMVTVIERVWTSATTNSGPWANVKNRYLGLKFAIKGQTHYGWARLSVSVGYDAVNGLLTGYAYETIPGKPIIAGRENDADDRVRTDTASGSLGGLALGRK